MSLFCAIERSTRTRTISTIVRPLALDFLCPSFYRERSTHTTRPVVNVPRRKIHATAPPAMQKSKEMDTAFIQALIRAGTCNEHRRKVSNTRRSAQVRASCHSARGTSTSSTPRRQFCTGLKKRNSAQPEPAEVEITQEEALNLVHTYDSYWEPRRKPKQQTQTVDQDIQITDHYEFDPIRIRRVIGKSEEEVEIIEELQRLLSDEESSHEAIYQLYKALPFPGVSYLPIRTTRHLLRHLSVVYKKTETAALRYLSILDDMKAAQIPLTTAEWNSAISFVGRCFKKVSASELSSALYVWHSMQKDEGVNVDYYTFNILFDISSKAGRFSLAEKLYGEMKKRSIPLSLHFKTSLIYHHGLRRNGDMVRRAYRDLVLDGHIVDTVVLNCVISAFYHAGEAVSAEEVFVRMKDLHNQKLSPKPPIHYDWRAQRRHGKNASRAHFLRFSRGGGGDSTLLQEMHRSSPVAPNITTYRLLIGYHAGSSGNLDRVQDLLGEMDAQDLSRDGAIFYYLLKGFSEFGGVPYTTWSRVRLERIWYSLREAIDEDIESVTLDTGLAVMTIKAFGKCTGYERVMEVWEEIRERWGERMGQDEERSCLDALRSYVPRHMGGGLNDV